MLDGVIYTEIVEDSWDMELFNNFVENLLEFMQLWDPITHPTQSVLMLDNCKIHKDPELVDRVESR
jgi:hypothetical protein